MKKLFFAKENEHFNDLGLARNYLPEWYKQTNKFPVEDKRYVGNFKACSPFLDTLISGYMLTTQCEIFVEQTNEGPLFSWKADWEPLHSRPKNTTGGFPVPDEYSDQPFAWWTEYSIKVPKGYSLLITHPLNRPDLPFFTTSGIVDADNILVRGHLPFFLKKGFEGVIDLNTPYAQIIPIKRESWVAQHTPELQNEVNKTLFKMSQRLSGYYKNNVWNKKSYR